MTTIFLLLSFLVLVMATGRYSEDGLGVSGARVKSVNGFYAAEAGLNRKFSLLRDSFYSFVVPAGSPPDATPPCGEDGRLLAGSGDFACEITELGKYRATSYIVPESDNPRGIRVPPGDRFEGLFALEYGYEIGSRAFSDATNEEVASKRILLRNRTIPLFQFAGFSAQDLELFNGPKMVIAGPVHTNGDLYLDTNTELDFLGSLSASGQIYRGLKYTSNGCLGGSVGGLSTYGAEITFPACSTRTPMTSEDLKNFNGSVRNLVEPPELPSAAMVKAEKGNSVWDQADLRLVVDVDLDAMPVKPERPVAIVDKDGVIDEARSDYLHRCTGRLTRFLPDTYKRNNGDGPDPGIIPVWGVPRDSGSSSDSTPSSTGTSQGAWNYDLPDSRLYASNAGHTMLFNQVALRSGNPFAKFLPSPVVLDGGSEVPRKTRDDVGNAPIACDFTRDPNDNDRVVPDPKYNLMTWTGYGGIEYPHPCRFLCSFDAYKNEAWPLGTVRYVHGWDSGPNWGYYFFVTPGEVYGGSWGEGMGGASGPVDRRGNAFHSLEVDLGNLLTCIDQSIKDGENILDGGVKLSDDRKNGLVMFFTVRGPDSPKSHSSYGVVIGNGQTLQPNGAAGESRLRGLTVASDQRVFIAGNYNAPPSAGDQIPASIFADTIQVASEGSCADRFADSKMCSDESQTPNSVWLSYGEMKYYGSIWDEGRRAIKTTIRAAFVAGTDTSGGKNGAAGQDQFDDSKGTDVPWMGSGLMNFMSFTENWQNVEFEYIGSLVSLWTPQHYSGSFQPPGEPWYLWGRRMEGVYEAPIRNWSIDPGFSRPEGLPPLTPLINYVQQEVFE